MANSCCILALLLAGRFPSTVFPSLCHQWSSSTAGHLLVWALWPFLVLLGASVTAQVAAAGECADAALQPFSTATGSSSFAPRLHALLK